MCLVLSQGAQANVTDIQERRQLERACTAAARTTLRSKRYVEEGLRVDEHPLVRFAVGPAARRAALVGTGLDVWEVVVVVRDNGGDAKQAADYLELPLGLVRAAIGYYGTYQAEIDDWIALNERESAEAHERWLAGHDASAGEVAARRAVARDREGAARARSRRAGGR